MNGLVIREIAAPPAPEALLEALRGQPGVVLLRSALFESPHARYSLLTARPFLRFRSFGSRCELAYAGWPGAPTRQEAHFGNPWQVLDALMGRYELLEEADLPFPLGGCFGYWGYDLKNFVEPKLRRRALNDLELPDCHLGFYDSLVVFDHRLGRAWIVATGLAADGSRSAARAREQAAFWQAVVERAGSESESPGVSVSASTASDDAGTATPAEVRSNLTRDQFLVAVERAQRYIRSGDIYQVNLSQRLSAPCAMTGRELFLRLLAASPAPFAAYLDCGDFEIASSSPEQFLRLSGAHVLTRPIKGTRPRSPDPVRDAQLAWELQTSPKELAELVMITDLLRNDLGKVCEFGSVQVPDLARLERYPQVQHLVSTVEGRLRPEVTHFAALAACFPGGSITGAPKFRAMEIIDELEPVTRGPYCGCHGYLGFNRESQLSITIRTAICQGGMAHFHVGAGIVADSVPEAEYEETLAKAAGFLAALPTGSDRRVGTGFRVSASPAPQR
ncbi:MAG: aminodeoxychorismate synthase component I [Verrucomicrobiae bacterium]|nr:aminodeoxychorismate synthase component I [Verrucomicrobiae bacterium]MDW8307750.1 aminodeoxychorismate synthase component I [Verrucomicrobiales bacterium]